MPVILEDFMTFADGVTAFSALIAGLAFVWGVNEWRTEFLGKRRIELAEELLALFYEARDVINEIRNPFAFSGEGATRQRAESETPEEAKILDQAYVVFERYKNREKLFAQLRATRYRAMATFGSDISLPFSEINSVVNRIFDSARVLSRYWRNRLDPQTVGEERFLKQLNEIQKHEAIFWSGLGEDEIARRVEKAVADIEEVLRQTVKNKKSA